MFVECINDSVVRRFLSFSIITWIKMAIPQRRKNMYRQNFFDSGATTFLLFRLRNTFLFIFVDVFVHYSTAHHLRTMLLNKLNLINKMSPWLVRCLVVSDVTCTLWQCHYIQKHVQIPSNINVLCIKCNKG